MTKSHHVRVRRIYDDQQSNDGKRVLVDRLWPRGISKDRANLDDWFKNIAPSTELRKWYGHDPEKFAEFADRYRHELDSGEAAEAMSRLQELANSGSLTLLTASKRFDISEATVIEHVLNGTTDKLSDLASQAIAEEYPDRQFDVGDHVELKSGGSRGTITKVHTEGFSFNDRTHHAQAQNPQYEIKSDSTGHITAHKGTALTLVDNDGD